MECAVTVKFPKTLGPIQVRSAQKSYLNEQNKAVATFGSQWT